MTTAVETEHHAAAAAQTATRRDAASARGLTIAYLVNQYPVTTQSFIRREIAGLEVIGIKVERFAVRRWDTPLVDENDRAEQARTRVVLDAGAMGLAIASLKAMFTRPLKFLRAARWAWLLGRRSPRGVLIHAIYLAEACVLREWLAAARVPHVHAHFGTNSTSVVLLCRMLGGPQYSFTCHGPDEFDQPEALALREKVEHAAFVVSISDFCSSQIYRWSRFADWPKVKQVRCGVDAMFLEAPRTPVPAVARLVNVGRIGRAKGHYFLVQAIAKLVGEGLDVHLTLVGDGFARKDVEALIARHGIERNVSITGWQSNEVVRQHILASRALVMPSFSEGLPLVIMEALALRRPVLSTYIAAIPELVKPGECGWLVPAGSIDELSAAIRELLAAPTSQLERMGDAGAARVAERHDSRKEAARLGELFEQAVRAEAAGAGA